VVIVHWEVAVARVGAVDTADRVDTRREAPALEPVLLGRHQHVVGAVHVDPVDLRLRVRGMHESAQVDHALSAGERGPGLVQVGEVGGPPLHPSVRLPGRAGQAGRDDLVPGS
jgi:hypothetical protein